MLYTLTTELPRFAPIPLQIIQDKRLSEAAKLLYALLLNQMQLSQKNGWANKDGAVYCYFTQGKAAEMLGKGERRVKDYYAELRDAGYLISEHQRVGRADKLYLHVPQEAPDKKTDEETKQRAMWLVLVFVAAERAGYHDNTEMQKFLKALVNQYNATTVLEAITANHARERTTTVQQKKQLWDALLDAPKKEEGRLEINLTEEDVIECAKHCNMPNTVIKAVPRMAKTYSTYAVQYQIQRCFYAAPENPVAYLEESLKALTD